MKKILMVALEFPPCHSSGVQRTYKFAEYLCQLGWDPLIITATTNAYQNFDEDFRLPTCLEGKVIRVPCVNLKKLFSINGKYPGIVEYFDKYWPWYFPAVKEGLRVIENFKPNIIWSTYPIITAHLIAHRLAKISGTPWVMDYRDPVRQHYDPSYKNANWLTFFLEKRMIAHCNAAIFTTDRAVSFYADKYPLHSKKFRKISNGYSEKIKLMVEQEINDKCVFLHSGVLYDEERDISPIVKSVASLLNVGRVSGRNFVFRFRGAEPSTRIIELIKSMNVTDYFEFLPSISFNDSVREMQESDVLVLIQSDKFKNQVPGKVYEYCQFQKPIMALCSRDSATYDEFCHLDNVFFSEDSEHLEELITRLLCEKINVNYDVEQFSRLAKAKQLNELLNSVR